LKSEESKETLKKSELSRKTDQSPSKVHLKENLLKLKNIYFKKPSGNKQESPIATPKTISQVTQKPS
jgi:hypothetical protein